MKRGLVILITMILVVSIITSGCSKCPKSCDDNNACTSDSCGEETNFQCINKPLNGKQPGCSAGVTCGTKTCKDGVCEVEYEKHCCGNKNCETWESYKKCPEDCPNCDDGNDCTEDSFDYHGQKCVNTEIEFCCGNRKCEETESHLTCATDCPLDGTIELKIGYLNNPEIFVGTGERHYYSVRNCLSEDIHTLKLYTKVKGAREAEVTKESLERSSSQQEKAFIHISPECSDPSVLLTDAQKKRDVNEAFMAEVYFKFEYKDKIYKFKSEDEKLVTVMAGDSGTEGMATFSIYNSNTKVVS